MDNKEEYRKWGESAYYWNLFRGKIEQIYGPLTEAILERAHIEPDDHVLDIGGGAGEPSLTIKTRTGARVVYTDPSPQMAQFTRTEAERRQLQNMLFCVSSGDSLPFMNQTFDRIVARLSMMFVPDPARGAQEILRVCKKGGRAVFVVWNEQTSNPMHFVPTNALKAFIPPDPLPPDAPGAFRFAEESKLASILNAAGFRAVEESVVNFEITAIDSIDEFWEIRSQMSESLREKLAKLSPNRKEEAIAAAKHAVKDYYQEGRMRFPASVRVITALT